MPTRILLVFSRQDHELQEFLADSLGGEPGDGPNGEIDVEVASNQYQAAKKLTDPEKHFNLVVIGFALAPDKNSPVAEQGGLEFARELRRQHMTTPLVLLVPRLANGIQREAQALNPPVTLFGMSGDLNEVASFIGDQVVQHAPPRPRLDVMLIAVDERDWEYEVRGTNFVFRTRNGKLRLGGTLLRSLRDLSEDVPEKAGNWRTKFGRLGQRLIEALCEANDQFRTDVIDGVTAAGGLQNTRVRFVVERAHYPIVLEAILPPQPEPPQPWMIKAPLFRNISRDGNNDIQFFRGDAKPLKTLLICADTHGQANVRDEEGRLIKLKPLAGIGKECDRIAHLLERESGPWKLGLPKILKPEPGKPLSAQRLLSELDQPPEQPWDIIHFAGHSYHQAATGRGYLFVGQPSVPEEIDISLIIDYLRRAKLLYLSSCMSANATFAFEAAKRGIPAVVGFHWEVEDRHAAIHAQLFYRHLFQLRSLESAFCRTRRWIHERKLLQTQPVWASSVLVLGRQQ